MLQEGNNPQSGQDGDPDSPVLTEDAETSNDDVYMTAQQRRLAIFALRYTAPPAVVIALIFALANYVVLTYRLDEPLSWYGVDGVSFLRFYLPAAFVMPLIQAPLLLRRTLQLRIKGRLQPPLDVPLEKMPWPQWSIAIGVIAGGVWAAALMTVFTLLAVWFPSAEIGVWAGLGIRVAFTVVVGLSVAISCAIASVRIDPHSDLLALALRPDDDQDGDGPAAQTGTLPMPRGRLEVSGEAPRRIVWNRFLVGVRPAVRERAEGAVYFTGVHRYAFLRRFFILLSLSVLMASFGLYSNSSPVVIAAMLIAPLMTPIMGLTLALVTGRPSRQIESALLVAAATGYIVVLGWVTGTVMPEPPVLPDVLLDYTDPRLADLMIALLAGTVGMYVLVHTEASTALPGVAVAISLEPPIAATGLTLAWGNDERAVGAFLMFVLNLAAILGAGSLVLILSGFLPISDVGHLPDRIKIGLVTTAVALLLVSYPLYRVSSGVWQQTNELETVGAVVGPWAEDQDLEPTDIQIDDDEVTIDLDGAQEPTGVDQLTVDITDALGRTVAVEVRLHLYSVYEDDATPAP